jgi:hypothetical protein
MMTRKISKDVYVIAFLITTGVLILGVLLGLVIENARTSYIEEKYTIQDLDFRSSQLQYEVLSLLEEKENCPAIYQTLYLNLQELEKTRERIEGYSQDATIEKTAFEYLEREYFQVEVRYWLLATRAQEICDHDIVTLLSFYSDEEECPLCDQQSFVLSYLKKALGEKLLIFSFNVKTVDEPMIGILETAFNIESYPSLVINEDVFTELNDVDVLFPVICEKYEEKPTACAEWEADEDRE